MRGTGRRSPAGLKALKDEKTWDRRVAIRGRATTPGESYRKLGARSRRPHRNITWPSTFRTRAAANRWTTTTTFFSARRRCHSPAPRYVLACGAQWGCTARHMEARLLRADPAVLPSDAGLMDFARQPGARPFRSALRDLPWPYGRGDSARGIPDLTDDDWLYGNGEVADIERVIDSGIRSIAAKVMGSRSHAGLCQAAAERQGPGDRAAAARRYS